MPSSMKTALFSHASADEQNSYQNIEVRDEVRERASFKMSLCGENVAALLTASKLLDRYFNAGVKKRTCFLDGDIHTDRGSPRTPIWSRVLEQFINSWTAWLLWCSCGLPCFSERVCLAHSHVHELLSSCSDLWHSCATQW